MVTAPQYANPILTLSLAYSIRKCPVVERFNLTVQQLLYKIMAKNNSLEWVKYIDQAMKI